MYITIGFEIVKHPEPKPSHNHFRNKWSKSTVTFEEINNLLSSQKCKDI